VLTKVSELIDPHTGQWDEVLVRDNLWEMDARIILSTPLRDDFEDFPAWNHDSKGIFSVKSAYRIYVQIRDANKQAHHIVWRRSLSGQRFEICHVCPK
jgi:hypothetical protein